MTITRSISHAAILLALTVNAGSVWAKCTDQPAPGVDWAGCTFKDKDGADLNGVNLTGANLTGTTFLNKSLKYANLTNARAGGLTVTNSVMIGAVLANADLSGSVLTKANLGNANLTGANLHDTTIANSNLQGANLTGANFTKGGLLNVDMTRARSDSTTQVTDVKLQNVTGANGKICGDNARACFSSWNSAAPTQPGGGLKMGSRPPKAGN